ncbi:MAG: ATP-binding cassette domain-containing protein [Tannerellaceae bacterium]|nr:ATP-binding cassette domain-containing protein [Tannerellaceae bacterium]
MRTWIELEQVSAGYNGKIVLRDISLQVGERDFVLITGPNGGGKTTLVKVLSGLLAPMRGCIRRYGEGTGERIRIGYLPQVHAIDRKFPISVREVIFSGLIAEKPRWGFLQGQKKRVEEVLSLIGMQEAADSPVGELSGGQLQRALLGRAIVSSPQLLILDEPESHLDKSFEGRFHSLVEILSRCSAIVLVSHKPVYEGSLITHHLNLDPDVRI